MSTTTFGTINNIQFVTNRNNLVDNGGTLSKSHSYNHFCSMNCENNLQDNSVCNKCTSNCKAGVGLPCTPNGLCCNSFGNKGTIVSPSMSSCSTNSRFSSDSSNSSSFKGSDSMSSGLAVEEGPTGTIRFATDRPHLVSMGGGRLSTSVTLHPINEGKTVLGSGGMGVVPDIAVLGTGVEPEHCLLEHKDGSVFLSPLAPLVSIDGIKISSKTKLTQGCMICLGRSHYFRFNHPSEAKLMKAILPNARISMAPITFYPAVDNPEYFHMTAQEAAGSGEEIRVHDDESPPSIGREGERGSSHPPVPPRKNPPPSTLALPSSDNTSVDSQNNKESCQTPSPSEMAPKSSSEEYSDSENPPEVPPRSEGTCPTYVNTTASTLLSTNPKSAMYLGEYIYTKAEEDLVTSTNSLKTKEIASNNFTGTPTSVITHNGVTMAHNAMYRSIPVSLSSQEILQSRSPVGSPTTSGSYMAFFNTSSQSSIVSLPSSAVTSTLHCSVSPITSTQGVGPYSSPRTPLPVTSECSPKTCSNLSGSVTSPSYNSHLNSRYANLGSPVGTLEKDLKLSERKKQLAHEERLQEQAMASAEKARLEEILKMCAEYERQQSVGHTPIGSPTSPSDSTSTTKSSISPYHTLTQNRIKTNGSLPREKRSPLGSPPPSHMGISSPTGSIPPLSSPLSSSRRAGTPSEDELNTIFSFESDSGFNMSNGASATNRSDTSCPYPPFPNLSSGLEGTPSPPPVSPRSPYENISHNHNHMAYSIPQSPRTRIRTIVGKDRRDHCEVFENKMAFNDTHSPQTYSNSNSFTSSGGFAKAVTRCSPKENGLNEKVPVKPPRSPRIDRKFLVNDNDFSQAKEHNIIDNKYFADVTPKAKTNKIISKNFNNNFNVEERSCIAKRNCLPSVSSEVNPTLARSKVFEEHMIRNIQDTLNINDISSEVTKLKTEKDEALKETVRLKGKISDLESQENEALRELELERALLEGELDCLKYSLEVDEKSLSELLKKSTEMEKRHNDERANDKETINNCKMRLELAEKEVDSLGKNEDPLSEKELKEKSELEKLKHETLETERKIFEDTEFSQMESEALRESEREELNKEISDLKENILLQKEKTKEMETQMADITSSVRTETDSLETERQKLLSDVNKSTGTDLVDRLAQLHLLDQSQEDLDRINQIATLSPLEYREGTLGRKTSSALMEVERNRQLNLVKQGTQVINDEKRRVEELKRKVAHKVKAEWEERRKEKIEREVACHSLDSVGSEESSSLTSSDVHAESLSSDDVIAHRSSGGENIAKETHKVRQRDSETPPDFGEQSRPLSDASSSYDAEVLPPVRYREKGKTQQRPLTRYLPVRSEEHFDLRQHIESAGHQIELCPYLSLNQMSCRGYLHKLGSKFRTWQKRWFVFDRSKRAFLYYSDKSESKPRGGTYFQAIEDVYVDHHSVKSPSPNKMAFCVKTHDRTYQLLAPSPEAMRIWIDVIFTGAEGYQEFQGGT